MEIDFRTLDVFTEETFGGNPLGVFPDAAHLPSELMQKIAREMNLSETVFLGRAETPEGTARVRIFTPEVEVPFAGHPTVGAAIYLATKEPARTLAGLDAEGNGQTGLLLEENVGPVPAVVRYEGGVPVFAHFTTAMLPERRESPHPLERLAAMVGLEAGDIGGNAPAPLTPAMMSCGLPFYVIPVRTPGAVRRAVLNTELWRDMLADSWAHHVYLVCPIDDDNVRVRMFAPGSGVPEDPATGSAAAVLGGYLADASRRVSGSLRWRVAQGEEVGRPSLIGVEADRAASRTTAVRVGGSATFVSRGIMTLPGRPIPPPEGRRGSWLVRYGKRL